MATHVFVDESKARGLLVAAAVCQSADVAMQRKAMRGLLLPGQRRVHFKKESTARRREIVSVISDLDIAVRLYRTPNSDLRSRHRCLGAIVRDSARSAERLVVERDDSMYGAVKRVLTEACRSYGCRETLYWDLLAAHDDPLLWVPDAVAWCWAKGGHWRDLVAACCLPGTV